LLTGKDQPERLELRLRTARRGVSVETRPPARAVCRVHGALGLEPAATGERAGWPGDRKGGPARARAGQGWRMGSSGRVSRLHDGSGREGAGGARLRGGRSRSASEGASLGGSGAGTAGSVGDRRRGDPGV